MKRGVAQRVLLVRAHPVRESLLQTAGDRAAAALERAGHEVRQFDLYADDFDPRLSVAEWRTRHSPDMTRPELATHIDALRWADHLVLVYPTWFGGFPAILKGWLDRVWVQGVAYELAPGARRPQSLLRHLRMVTVLTTHGSSKIMNAVQGEPGRRMLRRGIRSQASLRCRTRWVALYGNDQIEASARERFLQRVDHEFASVERSRTRIVPWRRSR